MKKLKKLSIGAGVLFLLIGKLSANPIYSQEDIENYLSNYTKKEKQLIQADLNLIRDLVFRDKKKARNRRPYYLATAGGPGSIKSTTLETALEKTPYYKNAVYLDPDQQGLRYMVNTYLNRSQNMYQFSQLGPQNTQKSGYTHWRGASNYITKTLINEAVLQGYDVAHGTTSTSPEIARLLKRIGSQNYQIQLILNVSPKPQRLNALQNRKIKQCFYQVTPEDAVKKAELLPQRYPQYFQYADIIELNWIHNYKSSPIKAARLTKGKLQILDKEAYENVVREYERDRQNINNSDMPTFEALLKTHQIQVLS